MRRLFGSVLLWMLALALPLQGMAAAANTHCSGEHHAAAARTVMAHETAAEHAAQPLQHMHAAGGAEGETQAHSAAHSCSACASCCAGFALLSAPLEVTAPEQAGDASTPARASAASGGHGAPEKPPRAVRA
jgi:hypothetical protein